MLVIRRFWERKPASGHPIITIFGRAGPKNPLLPRGASALAGSRIGRVRLAVGAAWPRTSKAGQCFRDRYDHPRIGRFDLAWENRGNVAIVADQVFMEIPLRHLTRAFGRGPFEEGVRLRPFDRGFRGNRKLHAILM